jgi:HEAT repeat protein
MRTPYPRAKVLSAAGLLAGLLALAVGPDAALAADKAKEAAKYAQQLKTSKDAKAKVAALNELGKLGQLMKSLTASAVPDMMAALKDKDATVRTAAARNLGMVDPDPKEAVPALLKVVKDNDEEEGVRAAAIMGLGELGPNAKPALKELGDLAKAEGKDSKLSKAVQNARRQINQN